MFWNFFAKWLSFVLIFLQTGGVFVKKNFGLGVGLLTLFMLVSCHFEQDVDSQIGDMFIDRTSFFYGEY